jgi:hypothetical protein
MAQMSSPGASGGAVSGGAMLAQPKMSVKTTPKTAPATVKKKAGFFIHIVSAKNPVNYMGMLYEDRGILCYYNPQTIPKAKRTTFR